MGATAGLIVDPRNSHHTNIAGASRRRDRHRSNQVWLCIEYRLSHPFEPQVCPAHNHMIQLFGERPFIQLQIANIEIQTTFINAHLPTGDRRINQRTEQVHRRVHLHVLVAARPIQLECDRCADGWQRLKRRLGNMLDLEIGIFARIRYRNRLLIEMDRASVAWLTTTQGIKDRSVKEIDGKEKPPPDDSFFAGFGASSLTGFTNFGFGAACFLWRLTSTAALCGDKTPKPSRPLA